jgi:mevalonate kinase
MAAIQNFYSNGKLLLTGEYLVLDGALALALPTKFGQNLSVTRTENQMISWKSFDVDGSTWFQTEITFDEIKKNATEKKDEIHNTLLAILHEAYLLNNHFLNTNKGYAVTTQLGFSRKWGLGTSSTLINNVAQWTGVNAFELLQNSFGGSGYDIACAQNHTAILYTLKKGLPEVEKLFFEPSFCDQIYFVYLNKKQNSKQAIAAYKQTSKEMIVEDIAVINQITTDITTTKDFKTFENLLQQHETIMSKILNSQTVQELYFSDFNGVIKSLGAWGGDFVLATSVENPKAYFINKGFDTVIPYREMILNHSKQN